MKKLLFIIFAILMIFPWISQALYPELSIWEPIGFNAVTIVLFFIILKWGKP